MRTRTSLRFATLALLIGGLACAQNSANEQVGAARDSTAKGDTIGPGADSSRTAETDTATTTEADSSRAW
jgi:hypothetical protein